MGVDFKGSEIKKTKKELRKKLSQFLNFLSYF